MKLNKKIIICSTIKNNSRSLDKIIIFLNELPFNFKNVFNIFIYSDSKDDSKKKILNFLKNNQGVFIKKNPKKIFNRIKKLEICRNEYLNFIKKNSILRKYDYLLVLDADSVNNLINFNKIKNSIKKKNWSAIFANQKIFYYDIFALRKKNLIEDDFIKILKEKKKKNYSDIRKIIYNNFTRYFFLNKICNEKRFIKVQSAFGGLAIYKLKYILRTKYRSFNGTVCEHVFLNKQISNMNKNMFIDLNLINSLGINKHTINGILCTLIKYFANRFLQRLN